MATSQQYQRTGSFVPTTNVWEVSRLQEVDINSPEFKQLLVRLYQNINLISLVLNTKETGAYYEQEFVTGALLFPNPATPEIGERQIYRKVVNFGALPAAGTKSIAHNLDVGAKWTSVAVYGSATNPTAVFPAKRFISLPYVSVIDPTGNLELNADATNVNITTAGTNYSAFTITYVVLYYVTL